MKRELMGILACPLCKGELRLDVEEEDEGTDEVVRGTLSCVGCSSTYKITEGIPDLRPPDGSV